MSEVLRVDRDLAPAQKVEPLCVAGGLDRLPSRFLPKEDHGEPPTRLGAQRLREREQEARAVPGLAVGRDRSPVANPTQPVEQRVENRARGTAADVCDEADPARVALERGVEEGSSGLDLGPAFRRIR